MDFVFLDNFALRRACVFAFTVLDQTDLTKVLLRVSEGFKTNTLHSLSWLEVLIDLYRNFCASCYVCKFCKTFQQLSFKYPFHFFVLSNTYLFIV